MRVSAPFPRLPDLDFLPTLAQRRQRDFRRQCRVWGCVAACGALASIVPIAWDIHERTQAQTQLVTLRMASEKLGAEMAAFDITGRKLAGMEVHRRAALALIASRQPAADRLVDVMRACADGVRLTLVKSGGDHLRVEGYATTQSRVRETQKRLRALPWVRKVAEVESSVVPESVRRQWVGGDAQEAAPTIRRFTLRIEPKPASASGVLVANGAADEIVREEVPDAR